MKKNERSIDILRSLQHCNWFSDDPDNKKQISLFYDSDDGMDPVVAHFSINDFLKAVDFYQKNRDSDCVVDNAMQTRDGIVKVWEEWTKEDWAQKNKQRKVVLELKNYFVPQMLEFAYLLLRTRQTKTNKRRA